jgi:hypothetical protein
MPNNCFQINDDSFTNGVLMNHVLSVRVSPGSLESAVLDISQHMMVAHETHTLSNNEDLSNFKHAFETIVAESSVMGWHYHKVNVIIDTAVYTLMPDKLFNEAEASKYLELNHSLAGNDVICVDNIDSIASKNIYQVPCEVQKVCKQSFPDFNFQNSITILISSLLKQKVAQESVFVNFSGKRFDVIVAEKGQLKFCNSFSFATAQDIIFYILNIYRKLGFDPSVMPIVLAGEITQDSSAWEVIYRYIRNVSFAKRPANYTFCEDLNDIPKQMFYDLFHSFQNI